MNKYHQYFLIITLATFTLSVCNSSAYTIDDGIIEYNFTDPVIPVNPIGPTSPEELSGKNAVQFLNDENIFVGWNLGNTLDAVNNWSFNPPKSEETAWGNPKATQVLFNGIKELGFDIVRIPITWLGHIGPEPYYQVEETLLRRVAEIAGYARSAGLKVIINLHHDDGTDVGWLLIGNAVTNEAEMIKITHKFRNVWKQIAGYFRNYGDWLIFESFNEVQDGGWGWSDRFRANPKEQIDIINEWNQIFTNTVRESGGNNGQRFLMYPSYASNPRAIIPDGRIEWGPGPNQGWDVGKHFHIPNDTADGKQIITFHYYDPEDFHSGVTPNWGTNTEKQTVDNLFAKVVETYTSKNIPVIIGEIGPKRCSGKFKDGTAMTEENLATARNSRNLWVDYVFSKAKECGMIPVYWDNGAYKGAEYGRDQFGIIDRRTGQPNSDESRELIQTMMNAVRN